MPNHNPYPGINPHLNSRLQQTGGDWRSFHVALIMALFDLLDETLPDGYYAKPEASLQIGMYDAKVITVADVLVSHRDPSRPGEGTTASIGTATPTMTLPIPEIVEEDAEPVAVVIYEVEDGQPVTRIEVLSPANKPGGSHYGSYITKRRETLRAGIHVIEVDFLHEKHPTLEQIPSYPDGQDGAYPYHIIVFDPRPTLHKGEARVYSFGVFDALPVIDIPLLKTDTLPLDFGQAYHNVAGKRVFRILADHTQEPPNFEAYHETDREAIRKWMEAIDAGTNG